MKKLTIKKFFLNRLSRRAAFTVAEMMMAMLLVLAATGIVAGGIPLARNAFYNVTGRANGQALLSASLPVIRSELALASRVDIVSSSGSPVIYYQNSSSKNLDRETRDGKMMNVFKRGGNWDKSLVSNVTTSGRGNVRIRIDSASRSSQVITLNVSAVNSRGKVLARVNNYKIEVLNNF